MESIRTHFFLLSNIDNILFAFNSYTQLCEQLYIYESIKLIKCSNISYGKLIHVQIKLDIPYNL